MTSRIADIDKRLLELRDGALRALDVPEDVFDELQLAAPPQPEMGDLGFPCFVLARHLRKAPPLIAEEVAEKIAGQVADDDLVAEVSAEGPYVNFTLDAGTLAEIVVAEALDHPDDFGAAEGDDGKHWMVEFSAPNTNKPQHLGHVRNDLLGQTVSELLAFAGHTVTRVNLINDRGIHICKSMLAYRKWGKNETPHSAELKGDHLVGKYYVLFDRHFGEEYDAWLGGDEADAEFETWVSRLDTEDRENTAEAELRKRFAKAFRDEYFNEYSELGAEAKQMLRDWEAGERDVVHLWRTMNGWVFSGFDETYERLGVEFDRFYRESETYLLGKDVVLRGLEEGKFTKLDDGAVVCDLEPLGLQGQKVLLRRDGTTVYMTQDLGTAIARFDEYDMDRMVYVVGDEQDYHFQVLFGILGLVRPELAGRLHHLSYGMVELPEGKMKSREGKVVDADDLIDEMIALAETEVRVRYEEEGLGEDEIHRRAEIIGLAALKFFVLDFNPRTTVHFDPKKSIEFNGRTGPYCQYTYARIQSIKREVGGWPDVDRSEALRTLGTDLELGVIRALQEWPDVARRAARDLDPGRVTDQLFKICKAFSTMYNDRERHKIIEVESPRREGLLLLARAVGNALQTGLGLLGIETLDEM